MGFKLKLQLFTTIRNGDQKSAVNTFHNVIKSHKKIGNMHGYSKDIDIPCLAASTQMVMLITYLLNNRR